MITKYANIEEILDVKTSASRLEYDPDISALQRFAAIKTTDKNDGYLYVRCRAISSRTNRNHDGWPSSELAKAYKTFIGRPIFVDHNNDDHKRTRGVIVDSRLHVEDDKYSSIDPYYENAPENHKPPTWIELLLEVDSKTFPKLAKAIKNGDIDAVSMGANIQLSICSVCGHEAKTPKEYCSHISSKGAEFEIESSSGEKIRKRSFEDCVDINFFEISFVFDPADPTALISERSDKKLSKTSAFDYPEWEGQTPEDIGEAPIPGYSDTGKSEDQRVIEWKLEQLLKVGIPPQIAQELANNRSVDYQQAIQMFQHGASPEQLLRILSKTSSCPSCGGSNIEKILKEVWDDGNDLHKCLDCEKNYHADKKSKKKKRSKKLASPGDVPKPGSPSVNEYERQINYEPQSDLMTSPPEVDTLRKELKCPNCKSDSLVSDPDGMMKCPTCFTPETLIRTKEGYLPISTIEIGDEVLSENGKFNKVLRVFEREYSGIIYEIETHSTIEPIRATPEHPFKKLIGEHLKRKRPCSPAECERCINRPTMTKHYLDWRCAHTLNKGDYISTNYLENNLSEVNKIYIPEKYFNKNSPTSKRKIIESFELTPDFLWLIGLYIAEGCAGKRQISFTLHIDEVEYQEKIRNYFESLGFTVSIYNKKSKGVNVEIYSTFLSEWLGEWIGKGCNNKEIPSDLLSLPSSQLKYIIQGIMDGDGSKSSHQLGQTSSKLALQVYDYIRQEGEIPTINIINNKDKKTSYTVNGMISVLGKAKTKNTRANTWNFQDKGLVKIKSIKEIPYIGKVYNLEVENDPTYTVQNILVHNCSWSMPPHPMDNPDLSVHKNMDQSDEESPMDESSLLDQIRISPKSDDNTINQQFTSGVINRMEWKTIHTGASVETLIENPDGINIDTHKALQAHRLTASITYPNGETTNPPFDSPTKDMINILKCKKEANLSSAADVPIKIETTLKDLEAVLEIIHTGSFNPKKKAIKPVPVKTSDPKDARVISDQPQPVTSKEVEVEEKQTEEPEDKKSKKSKSEDNEGKLLLAFSLADEFVELGLVDSKEKLAFVSELEKESKKALEARKATLSLVKNSGLKKPATKLAGISRVPRLSSFNSEQSGTLDEVPFEAVFMNS